MHRHPLRPALGCLACLASWLACLGSVSAAESGEAASSLPAVVVTGSRLAQDAASTWTPTRTIEREEIERLGVGSVRELLSTLTHSSGALTDNMDSYTSLAPGASTVSLRGLGPQATLILLNGRRLAPYPLANYAQIFTNIDALPLDAIERVEVLMSGGAALYGSDAIAGVINIITVQGQEGLRGRISHQRSLKSNEFGSSTVSLGGGWRLEGAGGGHLSAHLELHQRDAVYWGDVMNDIRPRYAPLSPNFGAPSPYAWPGNVVGVGPVGSCAGGPMIGPYCGYDFYPKYQAVPSAQRAHLLVNGQLALEGGTEAFSELHWSHTQVFYEGPPQAYGRPRGSWTWTNPSTGQLQTFWYRGLPAGHPLNTAGTQDANFLYRFADSTNTLDVQAQQYRLLGGLRGRWDAYDWEAAAGAAGGQARSTYQGWYSLSGFHQVIGNDHPAQNDPLFFNRGYQIGQVNSAEVIDTLFPRYGYKGTSRDLFVDGRLRGSLMQTDAGPVRVVLGGDFRQERYIVDPDQRLRQGDIVANGMTASNSSRYVMGLFAELGVPLSRTLGAQLAARLDQYEGVASHVSPKVALRWQPSSEWLLRGSVEGGFRAPNLTESADSTKYGYYGGVPDPQRCPQAQALAAALTSQANALPTTDPQRGLLLLRASSVVQAECGATFAATTLNNSALQPETSRGISAGVVWAASRTWQLSADAWHILRRNEIGFRSITELLAAESTLMPGTVSRAPLANDRTFSADEQALYGVNNGAISLANTQFGNLGKTKTSGIDVGTRAVLPPAFGRVVVSMNTTYLSERRVWARSRNTWGDNLAGRNGFPRWKVTTGFDLASGDVVHSLRAYTMSGTSLQGDYSDTTYSPAGCAAAGYTDAQCRVGGYTRWDYALTYRGWREVSLVAHVRNVFQRETPIGVAQFRNTGGQVPPTDEDARGRMLRLALEWRPR